MNRYIKKAMALTLTTVCIVVSLMCVPVNLSGGNVILAGAADDTITLRVCSWEEYIDTGDWEEDDTIDLESGDIRGDNSMISDFEDWYYKTYGKKVKVEYSCLGTNEELYNMLTLGDEYDLVCPSEYMIMKLIAENWLEPFSEDFYDTSIAENYYAKGVSPFIRKTFDENKINGEPWSRYAAGYMWGITGIVYNPDKVTKEEASTWKIISNSKFRRQITIKDNVRDSMFAALGAIKADKLTSESFKNRADYQDRLTEEMNDTSEQTISEVQSYLQSVKDNAYSFETDSGKADMITGKVVAGYQWSGDAVYTMDQADDDDFRLDFAVPVESTNLYFDGWVMLKSGVGSDAQKKHAAQSFINFLSIPENAVRNMYYIGYTSVISGGDSSVVYDYVKWNYGADEDDTDTVDYPLGYFFSGNSDDDRYILNTPREQTYRQLSAQYPSEEIMDRSAVMQYFDAEETTRINQMWINVRCYNINNVPVSVWCIAGAAVVCLIALVIKLKIGKKYF
ncbi:MAG: extracellular solute-binding protein [Lachnospira sp.]|nr:extracellular solute-binding protein [Lachnospira sp.]